MRPELYKTFAALLLLMPCIGCPSDPLFVTTDWPSTGTETQSPTDGIDATLAASTTGVNTDAVSSSESSATTIISTTTNDVPVDCGTPSEECEITNREWCVDLGDLCGKTPLSPAPDDGSGTDYCAIVGSMCEAGTPPCQLCNYAANTCKQLGGGDAVCNAALAECLCHAQAHDLPID